MVQLFLLPNHTFNALTFHSDDPLVLCHAQVFASNAGGACKDGPSDLPVADLVISSLRIFAYCVRVDLLLETVYTCTKAEGQRSIRTDVIRMAYSCQEVLGQTPVSLRPGISRREATHLSLVLRYQSSLPGAGPGTLRPPDRSKYAGIEAESRGLREAFPATAR